MPDTSYANPNPIFQFAMRIISDISQADPVEITTSFAHQYQNGLIVRLDIPTRYGMDELNQVYGPITVTGDDTFTMDIDTTFMAPFVIPPLNPQHNFTDAQVVPIGNISSSIYLSTRNVLPN